MQIWRYYVSEDFYVLTFEGDICCIIHTMDNQNIIEDNVNPFMTSISFTED